MRTKNLTTLMLILLLIAGLTAQQEFKLGKTTFWLPDVPIKIDDKSYAIEKCYVKFVQDTLYYYEASRDKDEDRFFDELKLTVFPLKAIEYKYVRLQHIITERSTSEIEIDFTVWISMKYDIRKKDQVWTYTYNKNGKM